MPQKARGLGLVVIGLIVAGVSALSYGLVAVEQVEIDVRTCWTPALIGTLVLLDYALVTVASLAFGIAFSTMFLKSFLFLFQVWDSNQGLMPLGEVGLARSRRDPVQIVSGTAQP